MKFYQLMTLHKLKKKIVWTCHDMWPVGGIYHYFFHKDHKKIFR